MSNIYKLYTTAEDTLRVLTKQLNIDKEKLDGIADSATNVQQSPTNGYILINGVDKPVYVLPTVYKDLVFPLIQKSTGVGNPTFTTFIGNIVKPQFAVNDVIQLEPSEFIHEWIEGSNIELHIHWSSMTNVNAERAVKWELEYTYVLATGGTNQWITPVVASVEAIVPADTPTHTEFMTHVTTITPTGGKIGGQIQIRLKRITSSGIAPATNPFVTQVGAHVQCNLGSSTPTSK